MWKVFAMDVLWLHEKLVRLLEPRCDLMLHTARCCTYLGILFFVFQMLFMMELGSEYSTGDKLMYVTIVVGALD